MDSAESTDLDERVAGFVERRRMYTSGELDAPKQPKMKKHGQQLETKPDDTGAGSRST